MMLSGHLAMVSAQFSFTVAPWTFTMTKALRGETNRGRFVADSWEETKFAPSWEEL